VSEARPVPDQIELGDQPQNREGTGDICCTALMSRMARSGALLQRTKFGRCLGNRGQTGCVGGRADTRRYVFARARTWVHNDMLGEDQHLLAPAAEPERTVAYALWQRRDAVVAA
jgi:hypothetical protein